MFKFDGTYFRNINKNLVVQVQGASDKEGVNVQVSGLTRRIEQRWRIVYTSNMGDQTYGKKGTMSRGFGFVINSPFYLRSRLPMQRVVEAVGASNLVIKRWVRNKTQQRFFFDPVSKTIKSQTWKGYSIEISSNGGSNNLGLRTTNSRWW